MFEHDPKTCLICLTLEKAIPEGKKGITEMEASKVLYPTAAGLTTALASRELQHHGWRELPHPISETEDGTRFAPPVGAG